MNNLEIYERFRSVPEDAKKPINGGRLKGKTDINPMWRIKALTEQFGPCGIGWYYVPVRKWLETCGAETAAFVDIELYIKVDGEWSKPIAGTGGSMFAENEKTGVHVSDECYKMATTDAISVACKQLGVGADVYWDKDRTKYDTHETKEPEKANEAMKRTFVKECDRIGKSKGSILKVIGCPSMDAMTVEHFKLAMTGFQNTPSKGPKEPEPSTVPPDDMCGLPFN
ncbi:MAG: hypothetical protein J6D13_00945 [Clostridium sp.]|nr:hypothetical protein [Clostridium sp.]